MGRSAIPAKQIAYLKLVNLRLKKNLRHRTKSGGQRNRLFAIAALLLLTFGANVRAGNLTRGSLSTSPGAAATSTTSQTSTTATAATVQAAQTAAFAQRAQLSMQRSLQSLQALQAQMNAQNAANLKALTNVGSTTDLKTGQPIITVTNGVGTGGLDPIGGAIVNPANSGIQSIQLQGTGSGISLSNGGQVSLVKGTGTGQLDASGNGTVTTTGGTITATSGGLSTTTTSGGTVTLTNGGTVTTTGANETISTTAQTTVTISGSGGTITALNGNTTTFATPTTSVSYTLPAGSTVELTSAGQVAATGATTLSLSGAGSLATTSGGAVSNTGGTTTFNGAIAATLPGGSAINFTGNSNLSLANGSSAGFSVNVPASVAVTTIGGASISNTTGFVLPSSWVNVGSLTDSKPTTPASGGLTDLVTVVQTGQQALLQWNTFNVGAHTELDFDQSAGGANVGDWVAINEVAANIAPSWILGSIQAPGQVYVINPNGIIFGGTSQVNVHALVASSLPINNNLVNTGLLNNSADLSYLFSSLQSSTTGAGLFAPPLSQSSSPASPTEIGGTAPDGGTVINVSTGGVTVEAGAQIQSPTTPEHVGGRVALIGPSVENDGTISTPDGQTILAAGFQVGFLASTDPTLRGLNVYLGAATDSTGSYDSGILIQNGLFPTAGIASNGIAINDPTAMSVPVTTGTYGAASPPLLGLVEAPRADVYFAGANIQQNGIVDSSTSVSLNGRVDMMSAFDEVTYLTFDPSTDADVDAELPTSTGNVSFGAGSVTQILPEQTTDTVVGSQLALSSSIDVQGLNIDLGQGANILAPDASVSLLTGSYGRDSQGVVPVFSSDLGTITAEQGSTIDVSGSDDVSASVAQNIVAVQLRGTELANSPVQQNGALRGQTVDVDMSQYGNYNGTEWIGSPIGDLSGYAALIQHTAPELTVNGGSISLTAGTSVSLDPGSTLDVSGGSINYSGAYVQTTKVVTSSGQILDISQATPNLVYNGILSDVTISSPKWGLSQTYALSALAPQYQPGYVQGGNAGTLSITAPSVTLNGTLSGNTIAGVKQQQIQSTLPTTFGSTSGLLMIQSIYGAPQAGTLAINFSNQQLISGIPTRIYDATLNLNFQPGTVTNSSPSATEFDFSTDLVNVNGFGNLNLADDLGIITVPEDAPLNLPAGGTLSLNASSIGVMANISSPGGSLNFSASGSLNLEANLDVSGLIMDGADSDSVGANLPLWINGGDITLQSSSLFLDSGSLINVSGGLYVSPANKQTYGAAGAITLNSAVDLAAAQNSTTPEQSQLLLDAELEGYSGLRSGAGKLSIQAPLVQIGGTTLVNGGTAQDSLLLPASFFGQGGFGTFSLTALGDSTDAQRPSVLVVPGTEIDNPEVQSWVAQSNGGQYTLAATTLPLPSLRSPLSISLNAPGVVNPTTGTLQVQGNAVIGAGAEISLEADPGNSVSISGGAFGTVAVLGQILVPGGTISLEADGSTSTLFNGSNPTNAPDVTVYLGPDSILDASGATELTQNLLGLKTGTVLNGGNISVKGNILAESGSQILVNGASALLAVNSDSTTSGGNLLGSTSNAYVNVPVQSNGGSISLIGKEALLTDATLQGRPGGASAQGGSLSIQSGAFYSLDYIDSGLSTNPYPYDASLVLTGSGTTFDSSQVTISPTAGAIGVAFTSDPQSASQAILITDPIADSHGKTIYGYFSAQDFAGSGLASLSFGGNLEIASAGGNINLNATGSISIAPTGFITLDDPTKSTTLTLTAPYVAMGAYYNPATQQAQQQTTFNSGVAVLPHIFTDPASGGNLGVPPLPGEGILDVNAATLVDIGTFSPQGFSTLNINESGLPAGDVRGAGTIELQGDINIKAGQIYPATEATFTIAAYSGTIDISGTGQLPLLPYSAGGTLNLYADTINQDGVLRAPMGVINLGAAPNTFDILSQSNFDQTGTIVLGGSSVTSVSLVDPTTGQALIVPYGTNQNGTDWIDPAGNDITLAPNGALGIPLKQIFVVGTTVTDDAGAVIDVQGGGDLYSARWVTGTGGTLDILGANNTKGSFAVVAGYGAAYAPLDPTLGYSTTPSQDEAQIAADNPSLTAAQAAAEAALLSPANLKVGDSVYLSGGGGLAAGYYTLLPAEYALLPGGYLVTPKSNAPVLAGSVQAETQTDGSVLVTGYKYNNLAFTGEAQPASTSLFSTFEVASGAVVRARAEYDSFSANAFLPQTAINADQSVPRIPVDAGQLVFNANTQLSLLGSDTIATSAGTIAISLPSGQVNLVGPVSIGTSATGGQEDIAFSGTGTIQTSVMTGLGGLVDISSSSPIDIVDSANSVTNSNQSPLVLLTSQLNGLNAGSLLIGGTRGTDGETVTVSTDDLEVNDNGQALTGEDLILVSSDVLNIEAGSIISTPASNSSITPAPLIVDGNGALIRVSSGQNGQVTRTNVNANNQSASLSIAGAQITAVGSTLANPLSVGTLVLDSTGQFQLDSGASLPSVLSGDTLTFNAGQISILFPNSGASTPTAGLVLTQAQIQTLQQSVKNLNFMSYSSIDLYGTGSLGTDASGATVLQNLSLDAAQLRGYYNPSSSPNTGITLSALDSVAFQNVAASSLAPTGANPVMSQFEQGLTVNAPTVELGGGVGNNSFTINGFQNVSITAGKQILILGTAAANQSASTAAPQAVFNDVDGALDLNAPLITSQTGSNLEILAGSASAYQDINMTSAGTLDPTLEQGLDGILVIKGADITDSGAIVMPSGQVTLEAASGDLTMNGSIDVSGTAPVYNKNVTEYTNGGTVTLKADNGSLNLTGGTINVSAQSGIGTTAANAGSLTLQASGLLQLDPTTTLKGQGGIVTSAKNGPVVSQGQNGSFTLDAANTNLTAETGGVGMASDLGVLASILSPALGDFTQSQSIRIRTGDVQIAAATVVTANTFNLSADNGNVDVYGTINAAGVTGGQVELDASGNVTLHGGSLLTVAGQGFADSGKGGSVSLQGGAYNGSVNASANVTIAPNATVDLTVGDGDIVELNQPTNAVTLNTPGTLILQSGLSAASSVTVSGSGGYVLTPQGTRTSFNAGDSLSNLPNGSMVIFTGSNGSMTLVAGSAPVLVPSGVGFTTGSTVQLESSGTSSLAFQPDASVTLPQGTPGNDQIILYGTGTITQPGGTPTAFTQGAISLPAGSSIQFDSNSNNDAIAFANGGTGGGIPLALAGTDSLTAPVALGNETGTLKIIVPAANFGPTGIVVQGNILSPSLIALEGNQVYGNTDPTVSGQVSIDDLESTIASDAQIVTTSSTTAPSWTASPVNSSWNSQISTILGNNSNLAGLSTAEFGAEIVNAGGDLVLNSTWDLSSLSSAGIVGDLTLRASGNIILQGGTFGTNSSTQGASLTDGFSSDPTAPWEATLLTTPSWSFNLTAGSDLSASDIHQVIDGQGSLLVGYGGPSKTVDQASQATKAQGTTASTQNIFTAYYQTIRTGTGDINISTGQDVQLMNALANIYTAGRQISASQTTQVLSPNDFAPPQLTIPGSSSTNKSTLGNLPDPSPYLAQYSWGGGDVTILADGDIEHVSQTGALDSSRELPTSWLDRRGYTSSNGVFADNRVNANGGAIQGVTAGGIASTTWWVDFSNFSEGIGALGGGNVTLIAGGSVNNVDASIPTNARMVGKNSSGAGVAPNVGNLVELGGGDLVIEAGDNINGGVYYVERGTGTLDAGYKILTNSTRATLTATSFGAAQSTANPQNWLPTTLFLGQASFNVSAGNDIELGSAVNPFLLPQNISNSYLLKTYFSTYATSDVVNVESLTGNISIEGSNSSNTGTIGGWYDNVLGFQSVGAQSWSYFEPWLGLAETNPSLFTTSYSLLPPALQVVAFSANSQGTSGNINLVGNLTLSPSPTGNLDLVAANSINGLSYNSVVQSPNYTTINLSDANPESIPGSSSPLSLPFAVSFSGHSWATTPSPSIDELFAPLTVLFAESSSTNSLLQTKEDLHSSITGSDGVAEPLHYGDSNPVEIDAGSGDISGFTLYSAKFADIAAGQDITDIGFYLQNTNSDDVSVVAAGRNLIAYDQNSPLRLALESTDDLTSTQLPPAESGDIQIGGPGTLEVLAGQNLNLGVSTGTSSTGLGITSIGNSSNPILPFAGANIIVGAGLGPTDGIDDSNIDFQAFISAYLTPGSVEGDALLPDLGVLLGLDNASVTAIRSAFNLLPPNEQDIDALTVFYDVLRNSGRDYLLTGGANGGFATGYNAITSLFPGVSSGGTAIPYPGGSFANSWPYQGDVTLTSREIKTTNGGNISLLVPGGQVTVGLPVNGSQTLEQGIFTVDGGNISILANKSVNVGVSRIFTLNGGNEIIWSSLGDIDSGSSSKTVLSAPPTSVIVDPQSANVETDLAGLATGGGIGVLEAFVGASAASVDLYAPTGTINAGDAGIRASGQVFVGAEHIVNASNISAGGGTTGVPTATAPNLAGLAAASSAAGSATQSSLANTPGNNPGQQPPTQLPSVITVEVLGYGGGDTD
jgi:filamentous hemagglutinin family protein